MKRFTFSLFALLLTVAAFANGSSTDLNSDVLNASETIVSVVDVNEADAASCTFTVDIEITAPNGETTTYEGTVTVNTSCMDAIKAFASA